MVYRALFLTRQPKAARPLWSLPKSWSKEFQACDADRTATDLLKFDTPEANKRALTLTEVPLKSVYLKEK
jgi:hypothetical protein